MSKRVLRSLRMQLFCAVIISLVVAIVVFGSAILTGNKLLDRTVYGNSFAKKMTDNKFYEIQEHVDENDIGLANLDKLNEWFDSGEKVYLVILDDNGPVFESRVSGNINKQKFNPNIALPKNEYTMTLDDGMEVRAFLYYYAGDMIYFGLTILSVLLALVTFSICFAMLIKRKVDYIGTLKQELDILSGGQLEYQVTILGQDELGELAMGIDAMRRSIIRHQEAENQMRSANSELITAMSHDLRTPLTALLAYLEILERKKYTDEEQMRSLIQKSVAQTMRIKQMANELFEYFLAYATEWESADMENVDADELFEQILSDYAYALESKGMKVETDFSQVASQISVNTGLLQRALDNLYSNLLKYAEQSEDVRISYKREEDSIVICISNRVRKDKEKNDSTSIGLITCRRIIEYHKGTFSATENNGQFEVTVTLPRHV